MTTLGKYKKKLEKTPFLELVNNFSTECSHQREMESLFCEHASRVIIIRWMVLTIKNAGEVLNKSQLSTKDVNNTIAVALSDYMDSTEYIGDEEIRKKYRKKCEQTMKEEAEERDLGNSEGNKLNASISVCTNYIIKELGTTSRSNVFTIYKDVRTSALKFFKNEIGNHFSNSDYKTAVYSAFYNVAEHEFDAIYCEKVKSLFEDAIGAVDQDCDNGIQSISSLFSQHRKLLSHFPSGLKPVSPSLFYSNEDVSLLSSLYNQKKQK